MRNGMIRVIISASEAYKCLPHILTHWATGAAAVNEYTHTHLTKWNATFIMIE